MMAVVWDFWMRAGGSDTFVFHLSPFKHLTPAAQLLCALVRHDRASAESILSMDPHLWMLQFLGLLQENALASLSCTLIYELGLHDQVCSLSLDAENDDRTQNSMDGVWFQSSLLTNLQRMSGIELSRYDDFDDKFVQLLDQLDPMVADLVWPKGISLSRSLYAEPSNRLSGDLDCIMRKEHAQMFVRLCAAAGYSPLRGDAGFCNQLEVGPCDSLEDLFCAPSPDMVPSAVIGLSKSQCPLIDPKFNPLDRGLTFLELDRFFSEALTLSWRRRTFRAPSTIDHLIICLVHFEKDRFRGWKSLVDIHLLVEQVSKEQGWQELIRRCKLEGTTMSAWSGLCMAVDRFGSDVPAAVFEEIAPPKKDLSLYFSLTVEPLFYWNGSSLPALLLNAWFTADRGRKLNALREAALPSVAFISHYYAGGRRLSLPERLAFTLLHWIILICPALLVRATFGRWLWSATRQYSKIGG